MPANKLFTANTLLLPTTILKRPKPARTHLVLAVLSRWRRWWLAPPKRGWHDPREARAFSDTVTRSRLMARNPGTFGLRL